MSALSMPLPFTLPDPLLTLREAAAQLRVSKRTLLRWATQGRLTKVQLSPTCIRYKASDLLRLAQAGS